MAQFQSGDCEFIHDSHGTEFVYRFTNKTFSTEKTEPSVARLLLPHYRQYLFHEPRDFYIFWDFAFYAGCELSWILFDSGAVAQLIPRARIHFNTSILSKSLFFQTILDSHGAFANQTEYRGLCALLSLDGNCLSRNFFGVYFSKI